MSIYAHQAMYKLLGYPISSGYSTVWILNPKPSPREPKSPMWPTTSDSEAPSASKICHPLHLIFGQKEVQDAALCSMRLSALSLYMTSATPEQGSHTFRPTPYSHRNRVNHVDCPKKYPLVRPTPVYPDGNSATSLPRATTAAL